MTFTHCVARLMLSAWPLPAQRKAVWAAIARKSGAPEKAAVLALVQAALKSGDAP
jgi:hypothetical protein